MTTRGKWEKDIEGQIVALVAARHPVPMPIFMIFAHVKYPYAESEKRRMVRLALDNLSNKGVIRVDGNQVELIHVEKP